MLVMTILLGHHIVTDIVAAPVNLGTEILLKPQPIIGKLA